MADRICNSGKVKLVVTMTILLAILSFTAEISMADHGYARYTLFAGVSTYSDGVETTTGSTIGLGWGFAIQEDLLVSISGSTTETLGETRPDGQISSANTVNIQTGLTHFFNHVSKSVIIPFTGGGLSVSSYDFNFLDPDSDIGQTTGTAGGLFAQMGLEVRLSDNFTIIPQYQVSVHSIKNENGDSVSMISSGMVISLRLST